jgi:hydrogenase-4 membrane subunit HyfE
LGRLFNWGEGGDSVAVMFATVYIIWALFLFHSARAPLTHRLFLDFNLTANSAHMGAMLLMAALMPEHREHAAGVIALGIITTVPIGACWLAVRRGMPTARSTPDVGAGGRHT